MRSLAAIEIQRKWRSTRSGDFYSLDTKTSTTSFNSYAVKRSNLLDITEGSRIGAAMRELTAKHVALFMIVTLIVTICFTVELIPDETIQRAMTALHNQTQNPNPLFNIKAVEVAKRTSIPYLYNYTFVDGTTKTFDIGYDVSNLLPDDLLTVVVNSTNGATKGVFIVAAYNQTQSYYWITLLIFFIIVWLWGVIGLVSPVMILVVVPIERMIQLLSMLTNDPLGYQMTKNYKKFSEEEDDVVNSSWWEKEVLEGMET